MIVLLGMRIAFLLVITGAVPTETRKFSVVSMAETSNADEEEGGDTCPPWSETGASESKGGDACPPRSETGGSETGEPCLPVPGIGTTGDGDSGLGGGCLGVGLHPLEEGVHAGSASNRPSARRRQRPDSSTISYMRENVPPSRLRVTVSPHAIQSCWRPRTRSSRSISGLSLNDKNKKMFNNEMNISSNGVQILDPVCLLI